MLAQAVFMKAGVFAGIKAYTVAIIIIITIYSLICVFLSLMMW